MHNNERSTTALIIIITPSLHATMGERTSDVVIRDQGFSSAKKNVRQRAVNNATWK